MEEFKVATNYLVDKVVTVCYGVPEGKYFIKLITFDFIKWSLLFCVQGKKKKLH